MRLLQLLAIAACVSPASAASAQAAFGPAFTLSDRDEALKPQVTLDAKGNAYFVWRRAGTRDVIDLAVRTATGKVEPVQELSEQSTPSEAQLAVDSRGNAHFAWSRSIGNGQQVIETRSRTRDGVLGPVRTVSAPVDGVSVAQRPQLGIDGGGKTCSSSGKLWPRSPCTSSRRAGWTQGRTSSAR